MSFAPLSGVVPDPNDGHQNVFRLLSCHSICSEPNVFVLNQYGSFDPSSHHFITWDQAIAETVSLHSTVPRVLVFYPGVYSVPSGTVLHGSWSFISPTYGQAQMTGMDALVIQAMPLQDNTTLFQNMILDLPVIYKSSSGALTTSHWSINVICTENSNFQFAGDGGSDVSSSSLLQSSSVQISSPVTNVYMDTLRTTDPTTVETYETPPLAPLLSIPVSSIINEIRVTGSTIRRNGCILDASGAVSQISIQNSDFANVFPYGTNPDSPIVFLGNGVAKFSCESSKLRNVTNPGIIVQNDVQGVTACSINGIDLTTFKSSIVCTNTGSIDIKDSNLSSDNYPVLMISNGNDGVRVKNTEVTGISPPPFFEAVGLIQLKTNTGTMFMDNIRIVDNGFGYAIALQGLDAVMTNLSITSNGNGLSLRDCSTVQLFNPTINVNDIAFQLRQDENIYGSCEVIGGSIGAKSALRVVPGQKLADRIYDLAFRSIRTQISNELYSVEANQTSVNLTSDTQFISNSLQFASVLKMDSSLKIVLSNTTNLGSQATSGNVTIIKT